jgi:hypothetical protein
MENRGLLFIPDISGFTRFVTETEINHSRLIIQELLEILINANSLGLEISEIEGDAILFYKFGDPPQLSELYKQVEKMFTEFHRSIIAYEHRRYCQCTACLSAINLTLKVITHYGEFTGYNVKQFSKLIGKDIIVAHQLLKNDIPQHEYWLITQGLVQNPATLHIADWMKWNTSTKQTESGAIPFQYTPLTQLKHGIPQDAPSNSSLHSMVKVMSVGHTYETDIITLFHAAGDFKYRHRWMEGVKSVEELTHYLPRVGMKCRVVTDRGHVVIRSKDYHYSPQRIQFTESEEDQSNCIRYILEPIDVKTTRLTLEYYIPQNLPSRLLFVLSGRKSIERRLQKSMRNLGELAKDLRIPSAIS